MIHAILFSAAIVLMFFSWYLYHRNIEMFLCLLIAVCMELFYLPPASILTGNLKLLLLPILGVLLIERLLKGKLRLGRYGLWVLTFLMISALGVAVAAFHGQSVMLGLKAAKFMPLILVYFLLVGHRIDHEKFTRYFIMMAGAVALLAALQNAFHGQITIFRSLPDYFINERLGHKRIVIGQYLIPVAALMAFARYLQARSIPYAVAALLLFCQVLLVQQTRAIIFGLMLSMMILYFLIKGVSIVRVFILFFCFFLLGSLYQLYPKIKADDIDIVRLTKSDIVNKTGSFQGRINSYQYYWREIQKSPLLGRGIFNLNWVGNREKQLQDWRGMYLADIGITHFIVTSGFLGLSWFLFGLFRFWWDILRFRQYAYISAYIVLATCIMATIDMFLLNDTLFLFAIFFGLLSNAIDLSRRAAVQVQV